MSLCIPSGAPSLDQIAPSIPGCSKYVTFSTTFGAPVLQTTVCVAFGARRRAAPARLLGGALATSAARAGPYVRQVRAPSGFAAPRSPESVRSRASTPYREHFLKARKWYPPQWCAPLTAVPCMKWLELIGRSRWERGNPQQEKTNMKSGLARTDLSYRWAFPSGRTG